MFIWATVIRLSGLENKRRGHEVGRGHDEDPGEAGLREMRDG